MGYIPTNPPPKRTVEQTSDSVISNNDTDSIIDVAEVSPSAYANRMDFDDNTSNMDFDDNTSNEE
jgi:hypothetical protein